jgi:lysophospholipase L1-like esterase
MKDKALYQKTALVIISLLLALVVTETVLRLISPTRLKYYVWPPHLWHNFKPDTSILSGISPNSILSINSYGVRVGGGDIDREMDILHSPVDKSHNPNDLYCLCLGASTTECLYLDDNKTWEAQIAWQAKAASDTTLRFIGNIGKSGCTTTENYIHLKYCVKQYKSINTVILMIGNDMVKRLSRDTLYQDDFRITPDVEDSLVHTMFALNESNSWWRQLALFHLLQNVYHHIDKQSQKDSTALYLDDTAEVYTTWRLKRQHAIAYVDTLPDMQPALNNFERTLNLIIDEAQKQKLKLILVNQAALWKDTMSADEQRVLWMGGIGNYKDGANHKYYTTHALRQALSLYNQRLAKVCNERKVKLVDIDSKLPRTLAAFYDDCHFNEAGAKMVGTIIYNEIKPVF